MDSITALKIFKQSQNMFSKAELKVSSLAEFVQPFFDQEISVCMSTDGPVITDENGELGFVIKYLED